MRYFAIKRPQHLIIIVKLIRLDQMKNYKYMVFMIILLGLWKISNSFAELPGLPGSFIHTAVDEEDRDKITPMISMVEIRGLIKPLREAVLSTDVIAKIANISVKDGDHFKQGQVLIQFDCSRQTAELRAAEAETKARKMMFSNNQDLSQFNAVGSLELEVSKAQFDKALAELNVIKARNQECIIKAPWSGRVTEVNAHAYEVVGPGREIMKILDDDSLEIEMIVPSNWLSWLKPGIGFPITVDETGDNYEIKISRVGARVDPVSQTIRIFASFKDDVSNVLAGMSGTIVFDLPN